MWVDSRFSSRLLSGSDSRARPHSLILSLVDSARMSGSEDELEMSSSSEPRLSVSAVAHRLGVAPATLRTWARRYGLGPSEHRTGAHRRYTPADLARLQTMRRLTLEGVPPGEAARVALAQARHDGAATDGAATAGPATDGAATDGAAPRGAAAHREGGLARRRSGPGGRVLALPGADAVARGLGRAAMALDAPAVTALVRQEVVRSGVLHTWERVLRPVLVAVGARWAATGEGVEVEHLLSDCTSAVLREVAADVRELPGGRPVVLACAPDEQHALPLHALAAALAERGVGVRTLGPALPAAALVAAVRRTGPAVVFVWSQLPRSAGAAALESLPVTRPPTAVVVGGPGWAPERLPRRVMVAADLAHAVELVDRALLG